MKILLILAVFVYPLLNGYGQVNWELAGKYTEGGVRYYKAGDYQAAILEFRKAYDITRHPARLQNIATCYEKIKDYPQSIYYYTVYLTKTTKEIGKVNEKVTRMVLPYIRHAGVLNITEVEKWPGYFEVQQITSKYPVINAIAAITYYKLRKYERARQAFSRGLSYLKEQNLADSIGSSLFTAGEAKVSGGQYPEAKAIFSLAVLVSPALSDNVARIYFLQAESLYTKQSWAEAFQFYQAANRFAVERGLKGQILEKMAECLKRKAPVVSLVKEEEKPIVKMKSSKVIAGKTILSLGIISTVFGIAFFTLGHLYGKDTEDKYKKYQNATDNANANDFFSEFSNDRDQYKIFMTAAYAVTAIGVAGIVTGIVLWVLGKKERRRISQTQPRQFIVSPVFKTGREFKGGGVLIRF